MSIQDQINMLGELQINEKLAFSVDEIATISSNILTVLRDEIKIDPKGIGYAKMNSEEVCQALNNPTYDEAGALIIVARISEIFNGVAYAPNAVLVEDVDQVRGA